MENYNSDWQTYNQGWGDNFFRMGNMWSGNMGSNWSMGGHMMNNQGRSSPRGNMMGMPKDYNFGNNSPRSYGNNSGSYGNSGSYQGSYSFGSGNNAYRGMQYNGSGGMMQANS